MHKSCEEADHQGQHVSDDVADALFLPPCVLKARKKQSNHWARASHGWRPKVEPPKAAPICPPTGEENLFAIDDRTKREKRRLHRNFPKALGNSADALAEAEDFLGVRPEQGETLAVCAGDEPLAHEVLSPEESQAKEEIWNEVNKDILQYLPDRKKQRRKEEEDRLRIADRWQQEQQQLLLLEEARERRKQQARPSQRRRAWQAGSEADIEDWVPSTEEECDDDVHDDFWTVTAAATPDLSRPLSGSGLAWRVPTAKDKMEAKNRRVRDGAKFARSIEDLFSER